jgi:hypothetical protein
MLSKFQSVYRFVYGKEIIKQARLCNKIVQSFKYQPPIPSNSSITSVNSKSQESNVISQRPFSISKFNRYLKP